MHMCVRVLIFNSLLLFRIFMGILRLRFRFVKEADLSWLEASYGD